MTSHLAAKFVGRGGGVKFFTFNNLEDFLFRLCILQSEVCTATEFLLQRF